MKKLFFLGALFAVGLGFTACSSDKDEVASDNGQVPNGDSFISFAIQMPTAPATRANDVFDDGLADEYKVSDATLVLFKGENAYSATFVSAYALKSSWNLQGTTTDQITTTAKIVQQISSSDRPSGSDKLWAYVIINKPASYVIDGTDLKISGTAISGNFFACFGKTNTINDAIVGNKICMTNAPLASNPGGTSALSDPAYTVLEPIEAANIYSTKEEAALNPAATIHVERNVAKVTVTADAGYVKKPNNNQLYYTGAAEDDANKVPYNVAGWALSNKAPDSYFQRQVESTVTGSGELANYAMTMNTDWYNLHCNDNASTEQYRMVGSNAVATGKYRIYWGESTNYFGGKTLTDINPSTVTGTTGSSNPQYCYENTFKLDYQKNQYTTRAVIKMAIGAYDSGTKVGKTFYSLDGGYYGDATGSDDPIKAAIAKMLVANSTVFAALPTGFNTSASGLTCSLVTLTVDGDTKRVTPSAITLTDGSLTLALNTTVLENVVTTMFGASGTSDIYKYVDGISYYPVYIKHFGDDLTPWNSADHLDKGSYEDVKGSGLVPAKYLGRYSVLRNNWYDINVTAVKSLGSPTIPTPGTPWDDEVESWISVEIKVLSWAKRTQDVTL